MPSIISYWTNSPLIWLLATLLVYRFALAVNHRFGSTPLLHPVAVSTAVLVTLLVVTNIDYQTYFNGARFIHYLLGPATVALAVPLYSQIKNIRRNWFVLVMGALLGSAAAVICAMSIAWLLGASQATVMSMAVKSVTMPIALSLTERIGGIPSLTAALVMLTGIVGAATTQYVLKFVRITDSETLGFTIGTVAHGIGASHALRVSHEMGAFAGLAMGLAGVLTAFLLPFCLLALGYI